MKAMLIRRYGGPEVFEVGELATPFPGTGEVLVRVHGSSVNPVDAGIRAGMLEAFARLSLPAVLGVDVAGEVVDTGEGAKRFEKGERVFAFTGVDRGGGYGELAAVAESALARVPANLSWAEAGTVPGVGATAFEAFTVHAPVMPGMRVLVNGGAGGVGTYAIQIAKALGAEVTATCSEAKSRFCLDLGAERVIAYDREDPFATGHGAFDVVLNAVRGAPAASMRELLRPGGTLVTVTGSPLEGAEPQTGERSSRRTIAFFVQPSGARLEGLAGLIEGGQVRPVVERAYGWGELADAHRRVETGRVAGKVAVLAPEPWRLS